MLIISNSRELMAWNKVDIKRFKHKRFIHYFDIIIITEITRLTDSTTYITYITYITILMVI